MAVNAGSPTVYAKDAKNLIEVEIKFQLSDENKASLLKGATFVSVETFTDTYYDSASYALSVQDMWLRTRNNKFVLKIPAALSKLLSFDRENPKYEIEDEDQICNILGIERKGTLKQSVEEAGIKPLYTFTSTRQKYKKGGYSIDIDHVDYGAFTYDICEIEGMITDATKVQETLQALHAFAKLHGIDVKPIDGKMFYLLKRVNPAHYQLLQKVSHNGTKN